MGRRFFFMEITLSLLQDQRNMRAGAKGKAYHFGAVYWGLGV